MLSSPLFRLAGILLTLLSMPGSGPRAFASDSPGDENLTTCSPEDSSPHAASWLDDISNALNDGAEKGKPEQDEPPSNPDDLQEPLLSRLRNASREAARKCRPIRKTRRKLCGIHTSKNLCYRGVKDALVDAGFVDARWSEEPASDAHDKGTLAGKGFRNVMDQGYNSTTAPLGSVLVYSGGQYRCRGDGGRRKTCGHIEIKLNANEYCSDYCKSIPADNYCDRKLIGIYVKK